MEQNAVDEASDLPNGDARRELVECTVTSYMGSADSTDSGYSSLASWVGGQSGVHHEHDDMTGDENYPFGNQNDQFPFIPDSGCPFIALEDDNYPFGNQNNQFPSIEYSGCSFIASEDNNYPFGNQNNQFSFIEDCECSFIASEDNNYPFGNQNNQFPSIEYSGCSFIASEDNNYPFGNQNDQFLFIPDSESQFLQINELYQPNRPNQLSDDIQIPTIPSSTAVRNRHNGSGSNDYAVDLPTAQTCDSEVVTSKKPADYLSVVLEDSLGLIDCETPNDIQERPTRNPEHVAHTDDFWDRRESTESDTQADSSDSSDTSEEDELSENHPFRLHVRTICKAGLVEFLGLATRAGDSDTRDTQSGPSFAPSGEGLGTQGRPGNLRKRRLSRNEDSREDQDDQPNGKKSRLKQANEDDGPTLACPFYKRTPGKHSNCLHFRLKRIKDVKQHLKRKHTQPHYCPICGLPFEEQALLQAHIRARSCEDVIYTVPEGLSEEQTTRLGNRVSRTHTVTNQWYTIWDIVFPDTQRPASPFVESPIHEVLSRFREFWDERGQELISEHLQRTTEISYSLPREERDLNAFNTLLFRESMEELITRFMDRFADPTTSSPIRGVPTPSSNEVAGLRSDDTSDLSNRPDSFATVTQSTRELAVPHLVNDSGSDPSTQSSRMASALHTNTAAIVDTNAIQQVSGARPEGLGSLDDSRWMDEWMERQENNGDTSDPIGNDVPFDFDFEAFLQGGDSKTSEFDVPAGSTFG